MTHTVLNRPITATTAIAAFALTALEMDESDEMLEPFAIALTRLFSHIALNDAYGMIYDKVEELLESDM